MNELLAHTDREITGILETLSNDEWSHPSLCSEWTIREVALHLASVNVAPVAYSARRLLAHGGNLNRANLDVVAHLDATLTNDELIRVIAANAGRHRRIGRLLPPPFMLGDHVIHLLDIAVPLRREPALQPEALRRVLQTQLRVPNPFVPAARFGRGIHFDATDIDWQSADAPLSVSGTGADIALTLAGRTAAMHRLEGTGADTLATRVERWRLQ